MDYHVNHGSRDISLSKFDLNGNFILARTCGGNGNDDGYGGMAADSSGRVYMAGSSVGSVDFGPLIGGAATNPPFYGASDSFLAQIPTCWKLSVVSSGNGWSSLGLASPAVRMISLGVTTQVVLTAADWHRISALTSNGAPVAAAAGTRVFTQALINIAADISHEVVFAVATPQQTGYADVPTAWLTNWAESAIISDAVFSVRAKYLIGLDPTTSNTFTLRIEAFDVCGSNAVTVLKREHTGGLSPDGMHGQLEIQETDNLGTAFTNVPGTAATGAAVFDGDGRRTYTNSAVTPGRFVRGIIH
jgi:hypothetical protein